MRDLPKTIAAVSREEFSFAMELYIGAASGKLPMDSPTSKSLLIDMEEHGGIMEVAFTDTPMNRGIFAIYDHYKDNPNIAYCIATRFMILLRSLGRNAQLRDKWTKSLDSEQCGVAVPLVFAAAECPIKPGSMSFKIKTLTALAEAIAVEIGFEG